MRKRVDERRTEGEVGPCTLIFWQCDSRFDLFFSFSFSFANYWLVLVSFQFYQTC